MKRRSLPPTLLTPLASLALVSLVLAGCAPSPRPLARVGDQTITTADFDDAAKINARQYVPMGDAGKDLLVDELVTRKLFVIAAKHAGVYQDTAFLDFGRTQKEQLERELMFRAMSGGDIAVSEPEVHAAWERRHTEAHARVVFVPNEATARQAVLELSRGADFADVARRFNAIGGVPAGGDLGWMTPGSLIPPLDDWLASAPIGKVMGPAEARGQGWFLMRVEERRAAEPQPYVQLHEQIQQLLLQRKQRAWLMRNADWLKQAYAVRVESGAAAVLSDRLRHVADPTRPAPPTPGEASQTLATWSGGVYTLGDAWEAVQKPGQTPPNVMMQSTVERWIENQVFDRVMLAEAAARRMTDDPEPKRTLEERLNGYLLDSYYSKAVIGAITVTDADMRAEFERAPERFAEMQSAELMTLTLPESLTTESFAMHVGHAASLRQAAEMTGLTGSLKQQTVRFPSADPLWQALQVRLKAMRPGEYAGPFPTQTGQMVIQLVSKQQRVPTWETLDPSVRGQLQTDVVNSKRNARQQAVIDSLRHAIPVSVDSTAVRRLAWPMEALMPGLGIGG